MSDNLKDLLNRHQNLQAILRPFLSLRSDVLSRDNKIVNAYIYDWDNQLSQNNHILNAQLDFHPSCKETNKK